MLFHLSIAISTSPSVLSLYLPTTLTDSLSVHLLAYTKTMPIAMQSMQRTNLNSTRYICTLYSIL